MKQQINTILSVISYLFLISCFGCVKAEVQIVEDTLYEKPIPKVEYEYLIGPGDVIEIIYHYTPKPETGDYYFSVGDVFKVEFTYHSRANRVLTVRPDGSVTLPRKGDISVIGLTPKQLRKKVTSLYSDIYRDPVVDIDIVQYNRAIDHLKTAITTSARGQSKLSTVRPGGYLTLPLISDIKAGGKTLPQLQAIVTNEYRKIIDNVTISLVLWEMRSNLVYIMGEVLNPNYYLMEGPNTVMQILSRAGGVLDTAERTSILIISRDQSNKPFGRIVNLNEIIRKGNISYDITLKQYDIVYVPKSNIANAGKFIDLYINRMVPSFFGASYDLGGTLIRHHPIIK